LNEFFQQIHRVYGAWRTVKVQKTGKALKKEIFRTFIRTFVLKRYDLQNSSAEITGFRVYFSDFQLLSYLFREIFLRQDYYFVTPKKAPFIIDCGSNIGMSILFFKKLYPDARIACFEPDGSAFTYLEKNIRENNLAGVDLHMKAVMDSEGSVDLFYNPDKPGALTASTLRERNPAKHKAVEAAMLSKYIDTEVDLLKLDVEGAEKDVITELIREEKVGFIKQMVVEYHHHITPEVNALSQLLKLLEDAGFGYQIEGRLARPYKKGQFQDILIYAYQTSEN
jgi:FkbM family methyltransferase